jgi:23S rRNA (cytidine1920-2'-O)/16S rRNA (cytidine1409-2'-O)-methyltransferase
MRLDQYVVQMGWAPSRSKAQEMIDRGDIRVFSKGLSVEPKASLSVDDHIRVMLVSAELNKFVSRAGLKLERALDRTGLSVKKKFFLDVGQSTGGFTDCLLQNGAEVVIGLDVGHGQLHEKIRNHDRVLFFENINARELQNLPLITSHFPDGGFDGIVMDVSFTSQRILWPSTLPFLKPAGHLLSLVKPQYEIGLRALEEDESLELVVKCEIIEGLKNLNFEVIDYFPSEVEGREGTQEFFVLAEKRGLRI